MLETRGAIVSIGGGPTRVHPRLVNLNIAMERGVDVVATAYRLPFANDAVPALHCEAVLEHLELPNDAVAEMYRVLQPGGLVFAATPFLQPYHAWPDHYQNFTLSGHVRLFERAGFTIETSGACVGPTFVLVDLLANYARAFTPGRFASRVLERLVRISGRAMRLLDLPLRHHRDAATLCSTTFVLARKTSAPMLPRPNTIK
ncbi:MAG TPA: methyltransferase domain-containing protein [Thermoanaerobaculia bacterium]|nr:methyltransferase domain-containing protein [Thermoanaerobaculia bacterium]